MKITLLLVGAHRKAQIGALVSQYAKRLAPFCRIEERVIKPCPLPDTPGAAQVQAALQKEAQALLAFLAQERNARTVALCVEGRALDSEAFSAMTEDAMREGKKLVFCIGSSFGLSETVKAACDLRLSLSAMTLPHELARLFLYEQLYRAFSLQNGGKYHK